MLQAGIAPDGKLSCILGLANGRSDYDYYQKAKDVS